MSDGVQAIIIILAILFLAMFLATLLFLLFSIDKETVRGVTTKIQKAFHQPKGAHKRRRPGKGR